jgi:hypothetical protein
VTLNNLQLQKEIVVAALTRRADRLLIADPSERTLTRYRIIAVIDCIITDVNRPSAETLRMLLRDWSELQTPGLGEVLDAWDAKEGPDMVMTDSQRRQVVLDRLSIRHYQVTGTPDVKEKLRAEIDTLVSDIEAGGGKLPPPGLIRDVLGAQGGYDRNDAELELALEHWHD